MYELTLDTKIYIAGHRGLVGSALWRELKRRGHTKLIGIASSALDLRDHRAVGEFFAAAQPEVVVLAAARVGGILANSTYPADFISDNLRVQVNVFDSALRHGVKRLLFLGSSCIYPRLAPQPITEDALLTGPLEPTNEAYAIAKIAGLLHVQAVRRQHGARWICAMPTNLYGPNDNFDTNDAHVLPALLRRFHEAKESSAQQVVMWGTGSPRREFMHVDDMARACLLLLERYDETAPINIGVGTDISIVELAAMIADVVGYHGEVIYDPTKPDGMPRKLLDVSRLSSLGYEPQIPLSEGLRSIYQWFLANRDNLRLGRQDSKMR